MSRWRCDHCDWSGVQDELLFDLETEKPLCPACWDAGYRARPRFRSARLVDIVAGEQDGPSPRERKRLVDLTEAELAELCRASDREEKARLAHARSEVRLETDIEGRKQRGFEFMREEFKVQGDRQ